MKAWERTFAVLAVASAWMLFLLCVRSVQDVPRPGETPVPLKKLFETEFPRENGANWPWRVFSIANSRVCLLGQKGIQIRSLTDGSLVRQDSFFADSSCLGRFTIVRISPDEKTAKLFEDYADRGVASPKTRTIQVVPRADQGSVGVTFGSNRWCCVVGDTEIEFFHRRSDPFDQRRVLSVPPGVEKGGAFCVAIGDSVAVAFPARFRCGEVLGTLRATRVYWGIGHVNFVDLRSEKLEWKPLPLAQSFILEEESECEVMIEGDSLVVVSPIPGKEESLVLDYFPDEGLWKQSFRGEGRLDIANTCFDAFFCRTRCLSDSDGTRRLEVSILDGKTHPEREVVCKWVEATATRERHWESVMYWIGDTVLVLEQADHGPLRLVLRKGERDLQEFACPAEIDLDRCYFVGKYLVCGQMTTSLEKRMQTVAVFEPTDPDAIPGNAFDNELMQVR